MKRPIFQIPLYFSYKIKIIENFNGFIFVEISIDIWSKKIIIFLKFWKNHQIRKSLKKHFKAWHAKIVSIEIGEIYLLFNMASKKIFFFVESMNYVHVAVHPSAGKLVNMMRLKKKYFGNQLNMTSLWYYKPILNV